MSSAGSPSSMARKARATCCLSKNLPSGSDRHGSPAAGPSMHVSGEDCYSGSVGLITTLIPPLELDARPDGGGHRRSAGNVPAGDRGAAEKRCGRRSRRGVVGAPNALRSRQVRPLHDRAPVLLPGWPGLLVERGGAPAGRLMIAARCSSIVPRRRIRLPAAACSSYEALSP